MKLENGVLTINAAKGLDKDEKDKKGKYVRRERYAGSLTRSFYVGDHVTVQDVHPKYENGILSFTVPKENKQVEEKEKFIYGNTTGNHTSSSKSPLSKRQRKILVLSS